MRCLRGWARSVGIVVASMAVNVVLACAAIAAPVPGPDPAFHTAGGGLPTAIAAIAFVAMLLAAGLFLVRRARLRDRTRGTAQPATGRIA